MRCISIIICISCILLSFPFVVKSDLFSAVASLQDLLHTESILVRLLEKYLESEQQRIEKIKWFREEYIKMYKAASNDTEKFLSNPLNAYLLIKHLTSDLIDIEYLITDQTSQDIIRKAVSKGQFEFPDEEDLNGAVSSLLRLQDMYFLNTTSLAHGIIHGTSTSLQLTSRDCFDIGRHAFHLEDYNMTFLWMQEALNLYEEEDVKFVSKENILEYLAYSVYQLGNLTSAVKFWEEIVRIDPQHQRAKENLKYYAEILAKENLYRSKDEDNTNKIENAAFSNKLNAESFYRGSQEKFFYKKLCRGEKIKSPAEESKLACHYVTNNNSFLILKPVKEEELNLKPRLVVYHDVLSESEIEVIKNLAKPKLVRAAVYNRTSDTGALGDFRISKNAWLNDNDHEVVKRISQRFEAITGLTIDTSEELQVVNYGIGGYYIPHSDFATEYDKKIFEPFGVGNRIATWINYMSDVEAGGSTVFPAIGVEIKPKKGSAAFWYNLYRNGTGDINTRHAACPVLVGSKWISTKWFHEKGQEVRRPCTLNSNE